MARKIKNCADCGKKIWDTSVRCSHCSHLGLRSSSWNGGKFVQGDGYILIRKTDHPYAISGGYVFEHRLVMEKILGRYLKAGEVVHHINGDRQDNREANLELRENIEHLLDHRRKWVESKEKK